MAAMIVAAMTIINAACKFDSSRKREKSVNLATKRSL
jgi:hypothetical protein